MPFLYLLIVKIVEWLLPFIAFVTNNIKIQKFVAGRKQLFNTLTLEECNERYWFHCASLGEFEQARPVIEKLRALNGEIRILITFFSPSGYEQQKNYALAESVIYLPLDTPSNANKLIELIKPKAIIFVKYEIWYFYLTVFFKKEIPVYLISANFRPNQLIFKPWGYWLFKLLPQYRQIFLQTEPSLDLLKSKGLTNITLSGDTRYDRVMQNVEKAKHNEIIETFKAHQPLLILGSSWQEEEKLLLNYLTFIDSGSSNSTQLTYKIVIAPHNIGEKHINEIKTKFCTWSPQRYTTFSNDNSSKILILDTIGQLASAYKYADIAFIGGGFTGQLHNILEPLSFGVPVITGPIHQKFPEALMAKKEGVLFETDATNSLFDILKIVEKKDLKTKAKAFISKHAGATEVTIRAIMSQK